VKYFFLAIGLLITAFVLLMAAFWLTPPKVKVTQEVINGTRRLRIAPNFKINDFISITVSTGEHSELVALDASPNRLHGIQTIELPSSIGVGDVLTIRCLIQYDDPIPSAQTIQKQITVR